jgi:transcription termination/antitermination protein NusG
MIPEGIESLADLDGDWFVAHTKARCEKALAWDLLGCKIPCFLPMIEQTAVWGDRKRKILKPLFPSYVFFSGGAQDRYKVLTTGRVCQVIPVHQRQQFVSELDAIRQTLSFNRALTLYPFVAVGRRCRVCRGPLKGVEGVVIQNQDSLRIVLQVTMLGQGASLEIEAHDLEPAE